MKSASPLVLRLLGEFALLRGEQPRKVVYEKSRALLAYLALEHGRNHSRASLAQLFWPGVARESALSNLRQILHDLRQGLDAGNGAAPLLETSREFVRLDDQTGLSIDAADFAAPLPACPTPPDGAQCPTCLEAMASQAGHYRGEFMAGFSLDAAPDFDGWLRRKRESLHRHAMALYGRLADCHCRCGNPDRALHFAHRATELDSLDEEAQRRLIHLLATSGKVSAALRQFDILEQSLAREFGVEPEVATKALYERVRAGDRAGQDTARKPGQLPGGGMAESRAATDTVLSEEVRRVVVLHVALDFDDESEWLEPNLDFAPIEAAFNQALSHWNGQRLADPGMELGAVFGLAGDGEQAPRRALALALEIISLREFSRARIGICEGRALIGAEPRQILAGSLLPALAQRLALCGEPGEVIAIESLAGELGAQASIERLAARRFRGLPGECVPCRVAVVSERTCQSFPTAFSTAFVGRADECVRLASALESAVRDNRAVFVELIGLPGAGKSRLLAEFARDHHARGGEVRWISHRPELCRVPLGGLREASRFGLPEDIASTEGLSGRGFFDALVSRLFLSPAGRPVLLVFDDLHWADQATLELLQVAMETSSGGPVLVAMAARPPAGAVVPEGAMVTKITLQPLAMAESIALISAVADGRIEGASTRHAELARLSGGLPLYAEYLARVAREQPVSDASLYGILQSVLDRMGPEKRILQAAAIFGTSFSRDALAALLPDQDPDAALRKADRLAICIPAGDDTYVFRHALLRDCAYDSIPPRVRNEWHRQAAAWLAQSADTAQADMAQHLEAAHAWHEACGYWRRAALDSYLGEFARDAKDAVARALAAAERDDRPLPQRDKAELDLLAGFATLMTEGYGSAEARRIFAALVEHPAGKLPEDFLLRALCGLVAAMPTGSRETAGLIERIDSLAKTPVQRMMASYGMGSMLFWQGKFAESRHYLDMAIDIGQRIPAREWLPYAADSPVVSCRALRAINLAFSGGAAEAREASARAVADAYREGRAHGLCFALTMAAAVNVLLDDPMETERLAAEAGELATNRGYPFWQAYNTMFGMWAKARQGRLSLPDSFKLVSMRQEFAAASRLSPVTALWFTGLIFEALGYWPLAAASAGRALAQAEAGGDRYCVPDLMRLKARARHARGDRKGARHWLSQGQSLAESMGGEGLLDRLRRSADRIG